MTTAYKGFELKPDGTMSCRDKTYVEGETYTEDDAVLCERGMHACLAPIDVLSYYPPSTSVYHVVEVGDDAKGQTGGDSKVVTKTLSVLARLGIPDIVKAQVDYTVSRATTELGGHATGSSGAASATGERGAASATGWGGAASATGESGAASATGARGAASATGWSGAASATGEGGAASATGWSGAASATGWGGAASATGEGGAASATGAGGAASADGAHSVAMASGHDGRAKGELGCALFLAERDLVGQIVAVVAVIVGRKKHGVRVKPDTWYSLRDGRLVEVSE